MRWRAKWISTIAAEGMPVSSGKTQVVFQFFSGNDPFCVVPSEGKRVVAFSSLKFNVSYSFKEFVIRV
jgi:hypothetical protein